MLFFCLCFIFLSLKNIFFIRFLGLMAAFILCGWSFFLIIKIFNYSFWYEGIFFIKNDLISKSLNFCILVDIFSILLICLTCILCFICIIVCWNINNKINLLYFLIFLITFLLIIAFCVVDLLLFYIFFEAVLIPIYLIIGVWGTRNRKITAAYRLFMYTLIGSIFFLSIIIYIYFIYGITDIYILKYLINYTQINESLLWFGLFIAFAIKMPVYPLHTWLPEAHAEAPTVGSILLAGILLKLGPYGLIRFSNFLLPYGLFFWRPFLFLISLLGLYYTSIIALRQIDIKKIIAYSSIGHMGLILLGLLSITFEGFLGSFILIIAHGFVSAGLFLIVGLLYDRLKTRIFFYYKGLIQIYPILSFLFFLFIIGNIGFPSTLNFLAEFLIIISLFELNSYMCCLVVFSSIFVLSFNLYLYSRIFYGAIEMKKKYIKYNEDLNYREFCSIIILIIPIFNFGIIGNNLIFFINKNLIFYLNNLVM